MSLMDCPASTADLGYAARLAARQYDRLSHRARRCGHDRDDFVQMASLAMLAAARTHRGDGGARLSTYAHRKIVWSLLRSLRRQPVETSDDLDPPCDASDAIEEIDLADLMDALDPETRGLVIAHAAEGRRLADLAAERGVSTSTVSRRYHGGLRRLRALAS